MESVCKYCKENGEDDKYNSNHLVLLSQISHCSIPDILGNLLHCNIALTLFHHLPEEIPGEEQGDQRRRRHDVEQQIHKIKNCITKILVTFQYFITKVLSFICKYINFFDFLNRKNEKRDRRMPNCIIRSLLRYIPVRYRTAFLTELFCCRCLCCRSSLNRSLSLLCAAATGALLGLLLLRC